MVCRERTEGNGHKLISRKPNLNIRKHLFTVKVVETSGHRLPKGVSESPSLVIFKTQLDIVLSKQL